jgi:hypothetical protein
MLIYISQIKALGRITFLATGIGIIQLCVAFQQVDDPELRLLGPLRGAGINPDDSASLIRALRSRDAALAFGAAYALGKLPSNKDAVAALTSVMQSAPPNIARHEEALWEGVAVYAARSLVRLHETDWIPAARTRLRQFRDRTSAIQLSAVLASQGYYDGWSVVHDSILEPPFDYSALIAVPSFVGMTRLDGSPVDIALEVERLLPSIRPTHRQLALSTVTAIRERAKR